MSDRLCFGDICRRLNLLIAIMSDSYEKVKESEHVEAIRERARIIVEAEKRAPKSHQYHRFMHYVEVIDSAGKFQEMAWEGMTNRVNQMMKSEIDRLDGELIKMKSEMNSKFEQQKSMSEQQNSKLELLHTKLDMLLDGSNTMS